MNALARGESLIGGDVIAQYAHLLADDFIDDRAGYRGILGRLFGTDARGFEGQLAVVVDKHDVSAVGLDYIEYLVERLAQQHVGVENGPRVGH